MRSFTVTPLALLLHSTSSQSPEADKVPVYLSVVRPLNLLELRAPSPSLRPHGQRPRTAGWTPR